MGAASYLLLDFLTRQGRSYSWYIIFPVVAVAIIFYGYRVQYRGTGQIMPVNYFGCLRYAQSVSDMTRHSAYDYSDTELAARGHIPLASVITTFVGLIVAFFTGWLGEFWVPFAATAVIFVAGGLPLRTWGPLATSCLEVVFSSGILYSLLYAAAL